MKNELKIIQWLIVLTFRWDHKNTTKKAKMDDNAQYTQVAVNIQDLTPPNKGPRWRLLQLRRRPAWFSPTIYIVIYDGYRIVSCCVWCALVEIEIEKGNVFSYRRHTKEKENFLLKSFFLQDKLFFENKFDSDCAILPNNDSLKNLSLPRFLTKSNSS